MFFPKKIVSIKSTDRVLEIGPGATPHPRSDVFLEKEYDSQAELIAQSGHVGILKTDKRMVTYRGDKFPFRDKEFDYVICSHVLEHVDNADVFLKEVQRVAQGGYLEFPTIYYDFLYNFPEHKLFLFHKDDKIYWMKKEESGLGPFVTVQNLFYRTCQLGYFELIDACRDYFFQGFEWNGKIESAKTDNLNQLTFSLSEIKLPVNKPENSKFAVIPLKEFLIFKLRRFFRRLSNNLSGRSAGR